MLKGSLRADPDARALCGDVVAVCVVGAQSGRPLRNATRGKAPGDGCRGGDYGAPSPGPAFKEVWQVKVWPKGLGQAKNLVGTYRLCLTDKTVNFVKLNSDAAAVVLQLMNVRRCGHSENFFFVEVGRSAITGPGEFWMQVEDSVVAQNMHETLLEAMKALSEEFRQRSKSQSAAAGGGAATSTPIGVPSRRLHPNPPPSQVGFLRRARAEPPASTGDASSYILMGQQAAKGGHGVLRRSSSRDSKRASLPPMALERMAPRRRPEEDAQEDYAGPGGGAGAGAAMDNGYMAMLPGVTAASPTSPSPSLSVSISDSTSKAGDDYMAMTPSSSVSPPRHIRAPPAASDGYMMMSPHSSCSPVGVAWPGSDYMNMSPIAGANADQGAKVICADPQGRRRHCSETFQAPPAAPSSSSSSSSSPFPENAQVAACRFGFGLAAEGT
ncbi:hypothetical protein Z043_126250, partial [Scleropages formosus]